MINFFNIFSLKVVFGVDLQDLDDKYFSLQRQFHPDKSTIAEIEHSIVINNAYKILRNPLSRAAHILQLNNIDIENDERAPKLDSKDLEEIFNIQERLLDFNEKQIAELKIDLQNKIKSLLDQISRMLDNKAYLPASKLLIKAKYFNKIIENL